MSGEKARPFVDESGAAVLRPCAFLFLDILGVREMATGEDAGERLADLSTTLRRPLGDFLAPSSPWPAAFFSDTLVVVDPIGDGVGAHFALIGLAIQASWIQVNLAAIVLSPAAVGVMEKAMSREGPEESGYLRVEQDGSVFIDYLDILLDDPADPVPFLEDHRDMVRSKLAESRVESRKWDKYRWVADYHDAYCRAELPKLPGLLLGSGHQERKFRRFTVPPVTQA